MAVDPGAVCLICVGLIIFFVIVRAVDKWLDR